MLPRAMLVCAVAALFGGGAAMGAPGKADEAERRSGKVVRVERIRSKARRQPRALQAMSQSRLTSYGWEPSVGTELVLLDHLGVMARAIVTTVAERPAACQSALYDVDIEVDRWERQFNYGMFGLAETDVAEEAKVIQKSFVSPSGKANEYVWVGFDRDGNGVEDLLVTSYPCADTEPPNPIGGPSIPQCIDTYERAAGDSDSTWQRVGHDVFYQCR